MDEKIKRCIEVMVRHIYDKYDGNEFDIYTLSHYYMFINSSTDIDTLLELFARAISDVTMEDFAVVYYKIINLSEIKEIIE